MTSVGRLTASMTLATVKVLPLPVIPRSTWLRSPLTRPSWSSAMALGWSPVGVNCETSFSLVTVRSRLAMQRRLERSMLIQAMRGFYGIVDTPPSAAEAAALAEKLVAGGAGAVQVRMKTAHTRDLLAACRAVRAVVPEIPFVV